MSALVLDGKALAGRLIAGLKAEVDRLKADTGKRPCFVNIVIGEDAGAASYGKSQIRAAEAIGIDYRFMRLPPTVALPGLQEEIKRLNNDVSVHGIMVHKPLPPGLDFQAIVNTITPDKDIEGMGTANLGQLMLGTARCIPSTPAAAMALILSSGVDLVGKEAVVVGRSEIVGKPMALLLLEKNATVTVCHSGTSRANRLEEHIRRAEVLVVAVGRPGFVKGEWVREGALVIDVGINQVNGRITGDVGFEAAAARAAFITPVPGGVGPVTAVMLMKNGVETFKHQLGRT